MAQLKRQFRPSLAASLVLGGLCLAFIALGDWQLDRAEQKARLQRAFEQAPSLDQLPVADDATRFARIRAHGRYDVYRHILVDNQVHLGRAGVHVLTPFYLDDGRALLVNRGWLPLPADRRSLPAIATPETPREISGMLDRMYAPGRQLGAVDEMARNDWPQLVTYPDLDRIEGALGIHLFPFVMRLSPDDESGFDGREWRAVNTEASRHRARALQWFTFLGAAVIIWIYLGFRRGTRP